MKALLPGCFFVGGNSQLSLLLFKEGNKVRLPGIGWMSFFQSRLFPHAFSIRSVTVRKKADGFYISVLLQDESVPDVPAANQVKTAVGLDMGIKKLMSLSTGQTIANPRFYQQMQRKLSLWVVLLRC